MKVFSDSKKSLNILFVSSSLGMGGAETWLVNLVHGFKRIAGATINVSFLTLLENGGVYEETLRELGCEISHIQLNYRRIDLTLYRLFRFMKEGGFDVVHCQSDYLSGIVMSAAAMAGIPKRLFHIHSTKFAFGPSSSLTKQLAGYFLRTAATLFSHASLSCSGDARSAFYSGKWSDNAKIFYCGIDIHRFEKDAGACRKKLLAELGLAPNTQILLNVGRISEAKNLSFIVNIMSFLKKHDNIVFVHAGDGPEKIALTREIECAGLSERMRLLGMRSDTADLMLASDLFVMPSLYEGLPLVLIEAQAAGLPVLASDVITKEVVEIPELFRLLSLREPSEMWSREILTMLDENRLSVKSNVLKTMKGSKFDINQSARLLLAVYAEC